MAIVINGSGTVTGISVGGLPDGIVDAGTLATDSVDSAELIDGAIDTSHLASGVGGKVLQVVSANYATEWSSTTDTYADTGLTATITPSATSSKILVLCNQNGCGKSANNASLRLHLYRDVTKLADFGEDLGYTNTAENWNMVGSASISYLDSPSSTSALVYKTQGNNNTATGSVRVQNSETTSTLTLIEIGA